MMVRLGDQHALDQDPGGDADQVGVATAQFGRGLDDRVQRRNGGLAALKPEALGADIAALAEILEAVGFRQLPIARWTATPLYMMEFTNPDTVHRLALPLKVTVQRRREDPDSARYEAAREQFQVEDIEDATGSRLSNRDVTLRLQTMDDQEGYWRDTGRISMN